METSGLPEIMKLSDAVHREGQTFQLQSGEILRQGEGEERQEPEGVGIWES